MSSKSQALLQYLKTSGAQSTAAMARLLGLTLPGIRRHLAALQAEKLVESRIVPAGVGRPKRVWSLSEAGHRLFPDAHAVVTVELIKAAHSLFGDDGLDRLIEHRSENIELRYRQQLRAERGLAAKVARLCALRSEEGYMAEWRTLADGALLLAENHCPICAAAAACQGFCRSELALFRKLLGPAVTIERIDHILAGARRCAYRIEGRR